MIKKALKSVGEAPILAIQFCIHSVQTVIGLIIVSPFYRSDFAPGLRDGLRDATSIKVYGILLLAAGVLGLFALYRYSWPLRERILSNVMFFSFLMFVFFTFLRLSTYGPTNLVWLSYLLNSLVAGTVYLRLRWLVDR